ncbi:Transcription termination factor MTEF1, chloroplastic [Glycine max]|nr:Transcription termination factor MTEF1, chloroplastic [Glycine max]
MDVEVYRKDRTHKRVTRKISLYLLIHHFSNWKHTPSILLLYYFHHYSELFIAIPHHNTTLVLPCFSFSHYPFRDPKWPLPPLSSPLTPCFQLNTTLSLHLQPFPNPSLASASPSIQGSPLPSPPSIAEDPNSLSGPLLEGCGWFFCQLLASVCGWLGPFIGCWLPVVGFADVIKWRCPKQTIPPDDTGFQKKLLYLESIGIDSFSLIENHPTVITTSLADIKSTVEYITSLDFTAIEFRRMVGMCPDILTTQVSDLIPVFTFLHREVHVPGSHIKRVINRRPRLLVCSVSKRLRPTLYFLQSIGIEEVNKHTDLLSCSVEEKFMPRIDYFENIGFSRRDATSMFRRFPQLFCYSIKNNLEPKYSYFVVEMGRDLKELKEFPQYFSFSLENRIEPRHKQCVEMGVCFPLPALLKTSEVKFQSRLDVCVNSSTPLKTSPLWSAGCDVYDV